MKKEVQINPFALPAFAVMLILNGVSDFLLMAFAAFIHEAGHLMGMKATKAEISKIQIGFPACNIRYNKMKTGYGEDIFIAAMGPFFNLVTAVLCFPFKNNSAMLFCALNMILAAVNLLPVKTLDGGNMLYAFFMKKNISEEAADRALSLLGILSALFLAFGASAFTGFNLTAVFAAVSVCVILLCEAGARRRKT